MSNLFVDKISGKSGTSSGAPITLSGDTATLSSGVDLSSATIPAAAITGTLGSGVTGGSGLDAVPPVIKNAVIFALNGDETTSASTVALTDWTKHTVENLGELGTFASPSSGVFTFPRTGFWYVEGMLSTWTFHANGDNSCEIGIWGTDDNSTYNRIAYSRAPNSTDGSYYRGAGSVSVIVDITNVTNDKIKFQYSAIDTGGYLGGGASNGCSILFIHLGDT